MLDPQKRLNLDKNRRNSFLDPGLFICSAAKDSHTHKIAPRTAKSVDAQWFPAHFEPDTPSQDDNEIP